MYFRRMKNGTVVDNHAVVQHVIDSLTVQEIESVEDKLTKLFQQEPLHLILSSIFSPSYNDKDFGIYSLILKKVVNELQIKDVAHSSALYSIVKSINDIYYKNRDLLKDKVLLQKDDEIAMIYGELNKVVTFNK